MTVTKNNEYLSENRPLITFALFAYNQEKYIREAIKGAFEQTYSPLEIILSDDCSSDRTYEIIEEMANEYDGSHKISLNKNKANLGLCDHINTVMDLVSSDWVVVAAGDDVYMPHRVSDTVKAISSNMGAYSIYFDSDYIRDDKSNQTIFIPDVSTHNLTEMINAGGAKVFGPSHAWNMKTFSVFGRMPKEAISEDRVIPFRSALLGEIVYIDKKVVRYRLHDSSISTTGRNTEDFLNFREHRLRPFKRLRSTFDSFITDLIIAKEKKILDCNKSDELIKLVIYQKKQLENFILSWEGSYFKRIVSALKVLVNPSKFSGASNVQRLNIFINSLFPFLDFFYHKFIRNKR